jgi:glycosyltransferase involved in cell wall biosynthesis
VTQPRASVLIVAEWINLNGGVTRTLLALLRRLAEDPRFDVTLYVLRPLESDLDAIPAGVRVETSTFDLPYLGSVGAIKKLVGQRRLVEAIRLATLVTTGRVRSDRSAVLRHFAAHHPLPQGQFDVVAAFAMQDAYSNRLVVERFASARRIGWAHVSADLYDAAALAGIGRVFSGFDAINCVSESVRQSMENAFPDLAPRLRTRYNPMDVDVIRQRAEAPIDQAASDRFRIVTVTRVTPEKGTDLVVQAAALLRDAGQEFTWQVIGPVFAPQFAEAVRESIATHRLDDVVKLVGSRTNPYPYIAQADLYVQPSRVEGFCTATVEATLLERPVVTTDVAGAREQFEHDVTGSVVQIDAEALASEILRLMNDRSLLTRYSKAAQEAAEPGHDCAAYLE